MGAPCRIRLEATVPLLAMALASVCWGQEPVLHLSAARLAEEGLADGQPIGLWRDGSGSGHHALQGSPERRPHFVAEGPVVRFSGEQWLAVASDLSPRTLTCFIVARAEEGGGDQWLLGKCDFSGAWSGFGLAVTGAGGYPWPHLGLGGLGVVGNGYLQVPRTLRAPLAIVEVTYDGESLSVAHNGLATRQRVRGEVGPNELPLLIGASPQTLPATQCLTGDIAEVVLYDRALGAEERARERARLAGEWGITLAGPEEQLPMLVVDNGYLPVGVENPQTPAPRALSREEAEATLRRDWLWQADGQPDLSRARAELGWTRALLSRLSADPSGPDLARERAELAAAEAWASLATEEDGARLYFEARRLKRRIALRNPALDFDRLLLIDQPYPAGPEWRHEAVHRMGHRAVPGGRLLVLEGLDPGAPVRQLFPSKPGSFWRPDVSFDARRAVFCYKAWDEASFHLYEIGLDGSGLRQLTEGPYDDIDPLYLPDGGLAFTTTRGNTYVRCGPYIYSSALARCEADGSNVRLLSTNSEPDFVPSLTSDGRIVYSRWEYSDKDQNRVQSLWSVLPDGTRTTVLWGNQSVWPDHLAEPREIPGERRVLFVGVGHHDWFSGALGIVDPGRGANWPAGLSRITGELPWAETGAPVGETIESSAWHPSGRFTGYLGAYPLSARDMLVSARGEGDRFRLYWMDTDGNRELLWEGAYNAWYAIPIRERSVPPALPGLTPPADVRTGALYTADVYEGVPELARGSVRWIRVLQQDAKTYSTWSKTFRMSGPPVSIVQEEAVKRIVTTAPVEPDGSAHFEVPAGQSLYFQALDERGRALQTMRSFTGVMPGESRGCVGCHESRPVAPPRSGASALHRPPTPITPPPWGSESIGYERFVQPVLDRWCGSCHQGGGEARTTLDLTPRPGFGPFPEPYLTLVGGAAWAPEGYFPADAPWPRPDAPGYGAASPIPVYMLGARYDDHNDPATLATVAPGRYLSANSRLIDIASSGAHHGVRVDELSLARLIAWVDANSPYLGEEEIRRMPDPDFPGIELLPIRPRLATAPVVVRP